MPASRLNFSIPRCVPVPTPVEPNRSSPGFSLAAAISSSTVVIPRLAHDEHVGLTGERSDRDEVRERVVREVGQQGRAVCMSVGVDQQGVTIGGGLRHHRWGCPAPGTGVVLDCHGLVPQLRKLLAHDGCDHLWPLPAPNGSIMRTGLVG